MAKFCTGCGARLNKDGKFCPDCGKAVLSGAGKEIGENMGGEENTLTGRIGFSDRINAPEITEYIRKSKKSARGCAFILIPLPFVVYLIVSFVSDEVETADALIFGAGISIAFFFIYLLSCFISNAKRSWDGVVTDKQSHNKTKHVNDRSDERWEVVHYTEYVLTFRTDKGKKERSVEHFDRGRGALEYYPYLNVGDRVRYYPQLPFKYEKYDKSSDNEIPCMICKTFNDMNNDRCANCNSPLFK